MIEGAKHDSNKLMWQLLPYKQVGQIVQVLTFGAKKYSPDNWQRVPDAKNRYFAAMMRHITSWWEGEKYDPESGCHHLSHAGCCLLFLLWFEDNANVNKLPPSLETEHPVEFGPGKHVPFTPQGFDFPEPSEKTMIFSGDKYHG